MITDFRLNVFLTVARTLSFTKAAAILNISQPAISKHIKELEGDIGEPLFFRGGNKITLTDKAKDIIPVIQTIMDGYHTLNEAIMKNSNSAEGTLSIGASTTISQYILPPILAKFAKQYPNISVSVKSANSDEIIGLLLKKEIEVAIIEDANQNAAAHYSHLAYDTIVLVSTKRHRSPLDIAALPAIPLLIREDGSGTLSVILRSLRDVGISRKSLNVRMQLGSSLAIIGYLKASGDYAFLSQRIAQELIDREVLHIVPVSGLEIKREFRFATLHGNEGSLATRFKEFCKAHYNQSL